MDLLVKGVVSGAIIVAVNLVARRNPTLAGVVVGFPTVTLLSVLWLVVDRSRGDTIADFVTGVLWGLIPAFTFVLTIVLALRADVSLALAILSGTIVWGITLAALVAAGRIAL